MNDFKLESLVDITLDLLIKENPELHAKFIDALRSGDTRNLTNGEINDLIKRRLLQKGAVVRAVVHGTIYQQVRDTLGESNEVFLGEGGYLKSAQRDLPELVQKLVDLLNSGESISNYPELMPLERYHLIFTRESDGLMDVHIMARTHLAYSTLQNIQDPIPEDF